MDEKLINAMDRALLFTFDGDFLTAKEGYVSKEDKKLYFYILDASGKKFDMYKSRQINSKPGVIRNRSFWQFWDGSELHKKHLAEKAALIFIDHYRDRYDKLRADLRDCSNNIGKLVDICDPEKNIDCKKVECFMNGGECYRTINKSYQMLTKEAAERM